MKKIFISHSSKDKLIVEQIIDLFEVIGVASDSIFCSSFEGYGVKLGENFLNRIKEEINEEVLMVFMLSRNYYESTICICEMGAAWVKTKHQIPMLIPPFEFKNIQGVIPLTQGMKVNEADKYNTLKQMLEQQFELSPIEYSVWERKRNNIIEKLEDLIKNTSDSKHNNGKKQTNRLDTDISYYEGRDEEIKVRSQNEWPNNFQMQVHYIKEEKKALESLKSFNPHDIDSKVFKKIRLLGRQEWPNNFQMQLHYEKEQVESLRNLKKL